MTEGESVPRGNRPAPLDEENVIDNAVPSAVRFGQVPRTEVIRSIVLAIHEQGVMLAPAEPPEVAAAERDWLDAALRAARLAGRQEAEKWFESEGWFRNADRLTAIIESRMSSDLAWLNDDGVTVTRRTPELVAHGLIHLYRTGDTVSGLPGLDEVGVAGLTEEGS